MSAVRFAMVIIQEGRVLRICEQGMKLRSALNRAYHYNKHMDGTGHVASIVPQELVTLQNMGFQPAEEEVACS